MAVVAVAEQGQKVEDSAAALVAGAAEQEEFAVVDEVAVEFEVLESE